MSNVGLDDVVEQVFSNESKVAINGTRSSFHECPCFVLEMWDIDVVVMKVGNGNCTNVS